MVLLPGGPEVGLLVGEGLEGDLSGLPLALFSGDGERDRSVWSRM